MECPEDWLLGLYDEINSLNVTTLNTVFRLVVSLVLGAVVGTERKRKGQVAGMRTFALISLGSCLAMLLSIYVPQEYLGLKNGDPGRIAAQVITGIGFIGGGAMIHLKGAVRGLTTAAGIWMTAIIGMAVGVGMYLCAIFATLLCLVVLVLFDKYEHIRQFGQDSKVINIKTESIISDISAYRHVLKKHSIRLSTFYVEYDYDNETTELNFVILAQSHSDILPVLGELRKVAKTRSITLTSQIDL